MLITLRHLISVLLLPFMVVVVIPMWLHNSFTGLTLLWGNNSYIMWSFIIVGTGTMITGLLLFIWCVDLFVRVGKGTLAPWDPTRNLVLAGPYRYARNPMIGAVALMLFGQTLIWGSLIIGLWTMVFVGINHFYFVYVEEPALEKRFGDNYRTCKARVPRWIPRWK
jgi:protein-S-isoprenylcysteine O-methyltransferase Ste14